MSYVLKDKLFIRPVKSADLDGLWKYCSSPEVTRFLTWDYYTSYEEFLQFFNSKMMVLSKLPNVFLSICYGNDVVGSIHIIERNKEIYQIGFGIIPALWRKGIGTRVMQLLLDYIRAHSPYQTYQLWGDIHKDNFPMKNLLLKFEFKFNSKIPNAREHYTYDVDLNIDFLYFLKNQKEVHSVFRLGSLEREKYSDSDLAIIVYEESKIEYVINSIMLNKNFVVFERSSYNHLFIRDILGKVFDVYVISLASIYALHNLQGAVFDKTGVVSKKFFNTTAFDPILTYNRLLLDTQKLMDKYRSEKYVQAVRVLGDIRDRSILPLYDYFNIIDAESIIKFKWLENSDEFKKLYLLTFVEPTEIGVFEGICSTLKIVKALIYYMKDVNLDTIKEMEQYFEFLQKRRSP